MTSKELLERARALVSLGLEMEDAIQEAAEIKLAAQILEMLDALAQAQGLEPTEELLAPLLEHAVSLAKLEVLTAKSYQAKKARRANA
jgi:hypothetical protein